MSQRSSAYAVGPRDGVEGEDAADVRTFEQHQRRADDARHADVLGGRAEPVFGETRQQVEVAAQARARRARRGVPVGIGIAEAAAQVDGGDEVVAGRRVEARQQARARPAQHRDGEVAGGGTRVGVAADDRHAVERGGVAKAVEDRVGALAASRLHRASTTASGRPPMAATSLRLTMMPQ